MKMLAGLGFCMVWLLAACGGTPHVVTQKVYEDLNREVGLQIVSERSQGQTFSHPAYLKESDIANVMNGLYVERQEAPPSPCRCWARARQTVIRSSVQTKSHFLRPCWLKGLGWRSRTKWLPFMSAGRFPPCIN